MSSIRPPSFPPLREDVPLTRTARLARTGLQEDAVALLDDSVELVEALSDDWDRQTYIDIMQSSNMSSCYIISFFHDDC